MPTFVWADEVPVGSRDFFTPEKRYPVVAGNGHLATVIDDEGDPTILYLPGCPLLDGRAWNVETVADPAPEPSELERLLAGIRAEIDWHEAEAKRLREMGLYGKASFLSDPKTIVRARAHDTAATRLRALLPQPTPEPEGK